MKKGTSFTFEGVHLGQTPGIEDYFKKIILDFDRIIEIGTYAGGLALLIYRNKLDSTELISYDINPNFNTVDKSINIDFRIGNVFEENIKNEIINLIQEENIRVLLLCDGGDKNNEFNLFSKYLKINDVIMIHDYKESDIEYSNICIESGWQYPAESSYEAIENSIINFNLNGFNYNEVKSLIWGSFIKT
jgi:hypothetical protein